MNKLQKAAGTALVRSLRVKRTEKVVIVTDRDQRQIARAFFDASREITQDTIIVEMIPREMHGEEPPSIVAEAMKKADVAVLVTAKSLSHTAARRKAVGSGTRIASMPGVTADIMKRCLDLDYQKVKRLTNRIADLLDKGEQVEVATRLGTQLSMNIKGRRAHGRNGGVFAKSGSWGNLPEGEASIAPVEGKTNGEYLVDISMSLHAGLLGKPIRVTVENGYAVKVTGSRKLLEALKTHGKNARNIAELGIGTNYKARPRGNVLEDEKVLGTCHIALGNSLSLGGKVDAPLHLDGVIKNPTIFIDGRVIMKNGKLLIEFARLQY